MTAMTPRERVWMTLKGERADRPPISFWGHVYHRESSAQDLVEATLERQNRFQWDWVKLNPRKHYHSEDWGTRYRYSGRPDEKPVLEAWPVRESADWRAISVRPATAGALGEQIEAVRMLRRRLPPEVPLIETVFTPLAVLGEMVKEPAVLQAHLRDDPEAVWPALEAVTRTYERFVGEVLAAGADGIYLATTSWGSREWISAEEHRRWSRPYDLRILAAAAAAPFNVLHVCKPHNLLFEMADYPVRAFSYDATHPSNPPLAEALEHLPGAVMGGVAHEGVLQTTDHEQLLGELRRGWDQTGGHRWMVAPGCSIPPTTPADSLQRVRDVVASWAGVHDPAARGA